MGALTPLRFDHVASAVMILTSIGLLALALSRNERTVRPEPTEMPLPTEPMSLAGTVIRGSASARAVVIEYGDFQCRPCRSFARTVLPAFLETYVDAGKVLYAFRPVALRQTAAAFAVARVAECAKRSGRFWELHDALFNAPAIPTIDTLPGLTSLAGLTDAVLQRCNDDTIDDAVQLGLAEAKSLRVAGTPTFFFGIARPDGLVDISGGAIGAISRDTIEKAVASLLKRATPG